MDVRCNRCATEYDFDDALISERGTTVKCTNCGYQFKVYPAEAQSGTPERWIVRTATGEEIVYTSLRELQRGIAQQQVGPNDLLSRGRQGPRPLGSIAELEPFFATGTASTRPARTLHGVAPAPRVPMAGTSAAPAPNAAPAPPSAASANEPVADAAPTPALPGVAPRSMTTRTPFGISVPTKNLQPGARQRLESEPEGPPTSRNETPSLGRVRGKLQSSPSGTVRVGEESRPLSPVNASLATGPASSDFKAPPASNPYAVARREFRSYDEITQEDLTESGRRARSRWIAAVVLLGMTTLFAVTVGRRYLLESVGNTAAANASSNAKVAELLREGNRLIEEGDLEGASEPLVRASALAEKDHAVLAALARLQTLRADVTWLKLRLIDPTITELVQATQSELGRRVGRARTASDAAFAVAPEDLVVLRARVDTLRLSGEADKAREWIKPIASNASDPRNAYVLAALDLADENPSWPSVIDRLRVAAAGERVPGRAHAALVYALCRAGRVSDAEAELAKLDASSATVLLFDEMKSFVKRSAGPPGSVASSQPQHPTKAEPAGNAESPRAGSGNATNEPARAIGGDFRKALTDAATAFHRGDLTQAEALYRRVLDEQPSNTEALSGLADIARRRNNPAEAARLYDRVLADNPSYLPALIARADQQWDSGSKTAAVALYRRVLEQAGAASDYGQRAQRRIAQAEAEPAPATPPATPDGAASAPAAPPAASPEPAAPDSAPEPAPAPSIDTTDLPGFK